MINLSVTHISCIAYAPAPTPSTPSPIRPAARSSIGDGVEGVGADLAAGFAMSRPAVSKHLRILRDARLVRERPSGDDGRQRVYELTPGPLREVVQWAATYETFWPAHLDRLKRHIERPRTLEKKR